MSGSTAEWFGSSLGRDIRNKFAESFSNKDTLKRGSGHFVRSSLQRSANEHTYSTRGTLKNLWTCLSMLTCYCHTRGRGQPERLRGLDENAAIGSRVWVANARHRTTALVTAVTAMRGVVDKLHVQLSRFIQPANRLTSSHHPPHL